MSKKTLKRELATMDREAIIEMMMGLYDARPEAKEYIDFYLEPDIDRRLEKARVAISKELKRTSKGRNKARITRVQRAIRDISSLNPGDEAVAEIMTYAVEFACVIASDMWIKESAKRGIAKILIQAVTTADTGGVLDIYLPRIEKAIDGIKGSMFRTNPMKTLLREALAEAIENVKL